MEVRRLRVPLMGMGMHEAEFFLDRGAWRVTDLNVSVDVGVCGVKVHFCFVGDTPPLIERSQ